MQTKNFDEMLVMLRKEIGRIKNLASRLTARYQTVCRQGELLKVDSLRRELESRRVSLARQAGVASLKKKGGKIGTGLAGAAAGLFIGGALAKDGSSMIDVGMSGFDAVLQEFGGSDWAVSLDKDLLIVQSNQITAGRIWVTLPNLLLALEGLKEEARQEEPMGDVAAIISKLKDGPKRLSYLTPAKRWVRVTKPCPRDQAGE